MKTFSFPMTKKFRLRSSPIFAEKQKRGEGLKASAGRPLSPTSLGKSKTILFLKPFVKLQLKEGQSFQASFTTGVLKI